MSDEMCYCPVCQSAVDDFVAGGASGTRLRAMCPTCGSLERNRFYGAVVGAMSSRFASAQVVLDIAPTAGMTSLFRRHLTNGLHLTCDFDPAADRREVVVQGDLTCLPLPDECVDILVCMQVLEHIPDDAAAMSEIRRVLKPQGLALVNVPYRPGTVTDEDPSAPVAERVRRFGQADHVRYYGDDFNDRLALAGLGFERTTSAQTFGDEITYRLGLSPGETFWFVWRGDARPELTCVPDSSALRAHIIAEMERRTLQRLARRFPRSSSVVSWVPRGWRRLGRR